MCCKRLYWRDVSSAVALSPILCGPSGGASARSTTSSVDPLEAPPTGPPVLGNRIFLAVLYQKSDRRSQKLFFLANIFTGRDSVSQCRTIFPVKMATKQDILHFEWLFFMAATAELSFMPTSHAAVPQICCRFAEQRVCYASIWTVQQLSCGSQDWNCLILLITHVLQEALVKRCNKDSSSQPNFMWT